MQEWHYESAPDLNCSLVERLKQFPREPDILCYAMRSISALAVRGWLRTYHRFSIEGLEHLPAQDSFVMVANHSSHLDALCLLSALPLGRLHRAFPAAAADYFFVSLPRIAVAAVVINALPFHRETHVRQSLKLCRQLLANPGNILLLFPEGTRNQKGGVGQFKPGVGTLLAGTGVPAVPCYLEGAARALPKGSWLPRPRAIHLSIGRPRVFSERGTDKDSILDICVELREAVGELAGRSNQPKAIVPATA